MQISYGRQNINRDDIREVITEYLLGLDYEPIDKMIATMTETGIRVWKL